MMHMGSKICTNNLYTVIGALRKGPPEGWGSGAHLLGIHGKCPSTLIVELGVREGSKESPLRSLVKVTWLLR